MVSEHRKGTFEDVRGATVVLKFLLSCFMRMYCVIVLTRVSVNLLAAIMQDYGNMELEPLLN